MRAIRSLALSLVALATLVVASSAIAVPVQYLFDSGFVTITASVGGVDIGGPVTTALDGIQVTIDEALPELVSIDLTAPGPIDMNLGPGIGYTELTIENLAISGGSGLLFLVSPGPPASEYFFLVDPLVVDVIVSAEGGGLPPLVSVPLSSSPAGSGGIFVTQDINELSLSGITIGSFAPIGSSMDPIVLKADFVFSGSPIPEPSAALLFAAGLLTLGARMRT